MNFKNLLLVIPVLSLTACTNPNFDTNKLNPETQKTSIIGGTAANSQDAVTASTVSLLINNAGKPFSFCTGTLISKNLVLTATHCLAAAQQHKTFYAYMGATLPTSMNDEGILAIEKWAHHPKYEKILNAEGKHITSVNDIAVVKLAQNAPETAVPVAVLEDPSALQAGDELLLAGYGLVNEIGQRVIATGLNHVLVNVEKLENMIIVTNQTNAQGACAGDSGGPAFLQRPEGLVVVGATRGPHLGVGDCRHFGEYTNASFFKDFIAEEAQKLGAETPSFTK